MAENRVIIEGSYNPATGTTSPSIPVTSTNTAATAEFVKITDGTCTATLSSNGFTGNAISVQTGFVLSGTTLNGVSANASGVAVDGGSARSNWSGFAFPTGTLAGTLTMELSDDGGNWVPAGTSGAFVAATNIGYFSTGRAARYARMNLTGASGTGTVLVRMMAAG